jgi:hypothetical protein
MNKDESGALHLAPVRQSARNYRAHGQAYLDKLPRYGGISGIDRVGLSVEECAQLVARFAAIKRRCVFIAVARMPGIEEFELKVALAKWMWEDATHYQCLEDRIAELRSNRVSMDKVLEYQLGDFLWEIQFIRENDPRQPSIECVRSARPQRQLHAGIQGAVFDAVGCQPRD